MRVLVGSLVFLLGCTLNAAVEQGDNSTSPLSATYDETLARELSHFAAAAYAKNLTACMPRLQLKTVEEWRLIGSRTIRCSWASLEEAAAQNAATAALF